MNIQYAVDTLKIEKMEVEKMPETSSIREIISGLKMAIDIIEREMKLEPPF